MAKKSRKAKKFKIIYSGPLDKCDDDLVFAQSFYTMTPAEKFKASWEMVVHAWKLKGKPLDELRLNRTTSVLKKIFS